MKRIQQGFTLIELMIVVAIIGILAAVAIPQYKNYTVKAKLGNALTSVDSFKTAVALCIQETGAKTDCDAGSNGIPAKVTSPTKEVAEIDVADGKITAKLAASGIDAEVNGKNITWDASTGGTSLVWTIDTTITEATFKAMVTKQSGT